MGAAKPTAVARLVYVALATASIAAGRPMAHANCNAIPNAPSSFQGALGNVDKPFASPGDFVMVTAPPSKRQKLESDGVVVTLMFTPPNGGTRSAVVLTTAREHCDALATQLAACGERLGGRQVCLPADAASPQPDITVDDGSIHFRFPDTASLTAGGPSLAGPVAIAVATFDEARANGLPCDLTLEKRCINLPPSEPPLVACVDTLFAADGSSPPNLGDTFSHFTALPPPNDYQALCRPQTTADQPDASSPCRGQKQPLYFAADAMGNALVPIDWSGVVEGARCEPNAAGGAQRIVPTTARFVRALFELTRFKDGPEQVTIPSNAFLRSFTTDGHPLAPVFEAHVGADGPPSPIFGFADGCRSVLRIARRSRGLHGCGTRPDLPCTDPDLCFEGNCESECPPDDRCMPGRCQDTDRECATDDDCLAGDECGPSLFEFRDRLLNGVGPIAVGDPSSSYDLRLGSSASLDSIQQTPDLIAFSASEATNGKSLNVEDGDDRNDEVLQMVLRRGPGVEVNTGSPVARIDQAPFSYLAMATEGDTVAFFEPEGASKKDATGDSDLLDPVLRVFKLDTPVPLPGPRSLLAASLKPLVNGRSLALSENLVFYRREDVNRVLFPASVSFTDFVPGANTQPSISAQYTGNIPRIRVAFTSLATHFASSEYDFNALSDIYVADTLALSYYGSAALMVVAGPLSRGITGCAAHEEGCGADGNSFTPAVSRDGTTVAFVSEATNLVARDGTSVDNGADADVFVAYNPGFNTVAIVEQVSVDSDGMPGSGSSLPYPAISADGRYVAFASTASLVADDTNGVADVFVRDTCMSRGQPVVLCRPFTKRVSESSCGAEGLGASRRPSISADGRFVAFTSDAANLAVTAADCDHSIDTNGVSDVFVHDRTTGKTERVSIGVGGEEANGASGLGAISGDGNVVAFASEADNIVGGDTNGVADIFVRGRRTGSPTATTERVSISVKGIEGDRPSPPSAPPLQHQAATLDDRDAPAISEDGSVIAFASDATNLVDGDSNDTADVFVRNCASGTTERASVVPAGPESNGASRAPAMSSDGKQIAFETTGSNLAPPVYPYGADSNGVADIFVQATFPTDGSHRAPTYEQHLGVLDTRTNTYATSVDGCAAMPVTVAGDHVAFVGARCPDALPSANDDDFYFAVRLWSPEAPRVKNYRCFATATALSTEWIAALAYERQQRHGHEMPDGDENGDGDEEDRVVKVRRLDDPAPHDCSSWRVVRDSDGRGQAAVDPDGSGEGFAVSGSVVVFTTLESEQGQDLNGDCDTTDEVLQVYDASPAGGLHTVGRPAEDFVLGTRFVAFRTHESDLCGAALDVTDCTAPSCEVGCGTDGTPIGCDLNCDRDCSDDVLQIYDFSGGIDHGCLINTKQAVVPCPFPACDPRLPYRVGDSTVTFVTPVDSEHGPGPSVGSESVGALILQTLNERLAYEQVCNDSPEPRAEHARSLRRAAAPATGPVMRLGAVFRGLCTNSSTPCVRDDDCRSDGGNGTCVLPPRRCIVNAGTPCILGCGADQFCAPSPERLGELSCQRLQENRLVICDGDGDCANGARCTEGTTPLISPLSGPTVGAPVFVSAGQCVESGDEAGGKTRVHGTCMTDEDCPPLGSGRITCKPTLIATGAADTDGDEIPDPFDNCPTVPNVLQDAAACRAVGCPDQPEPGCTAPRSGEAHLALDTTRRSDHQLVWRWTQRNTPSREFGDPVHDDPYALCVYDVSDASTPRLRLGLTVPPGHLCDTGRCWRATRDRSFTYEDTRAAAVGISALELRAMRNGAADIRLEARGAGLIASALPLTIPVKAQLVNLATRSCWEASYTRARRSEDEIFQATSD